MSEKDIHASQRGGESSIKGFRYQREFIALLCAKMICKKGKISKIICEYRNDIEIVVDQKLASWQIKLTSSNKVKFEKVYDSIKLFNHLNTTKYSQFVLVSNRNFADFCSIFLH
jgi:Cap4 dsDNA endonuclease